MDIDPYRSLKLPIFDVSNIGVQHPPNRPCGKIHLKRQASPIHEKNTFVRTARYSSLSALKKLKNKPHMSRELGFKLSQDVDSGVLLKISDFLELPEVKAAGITATNYHQFVVPSPIHIVANLGSRSSPICLVVAPNRENQTI